MHEEFLSVSLLCLYDQILKNYMFFSIFSGYVTNIILFIVLCGNSMEGMAICSNTGYL
jgi:hypothetical protein